MEYPLVDINEVEKTKDRILLAAVMLFAERGYAAVSVRDIADHVKIKPASLYNHFESKEVLFDTIVETIKTVYLEFYDRMEERIATAACFADVLDSLFDELIDVYHMFVYYGVSLISTEQFRNEAARHAFNDVYMKVGIEYSEHLFNTSIEKGWVKPFSTRAMATTFMNNVFAGSMIRTQEHLGRKTVYSSREMFIDLKQHMLDSVEVIA